MTPCHLDWHPQLPKTNVSLTVSYCHNCQAWSLMFSSLMFDGDTTDVLFDNYHRNFGPFDSLGLVLDEACDALAKELLSPGRPWDAGPLSLMEPRFPESL